MDPPFGDVPPRAGIKSPLGHCGLPTELAVSYRQNCGGDRLLLCPWSLTSAHHGAGFVTGLRQPVCGVLAGLWRGCRLAGWCWSVVAVGAAGGQPSGW